MLTPELPFHIPHTSVILPFFYPSISERPGLIISLLKSLHLALDDKIRQVKNIVYVQLNSIFLFRRHFGYLRP